MNTPTPHYFIGLDPGTETGLAVWDAQGQVFARSLLTTTFWDAYDLVLTFDPDTVLIVLEDPSKNPPTFSRNIPESERAFRKRERLSRNVGSNMREALLLAEGLERQGYRVRRVRPRSSKLSAEAFRRLTRHEGRTSAHARDAAMLVFGLKKAPPELPLAISDRQSLGEATLGLYAPPPRRKK